MTLLLAGLVFTAGALVLVVSIRRRRAALPSWDPVEVARLERILQIGTPVWDIDFTAPLVDPSPPYPPIRLKGERNHGGYVSSPIPVAQLPKVASGPAPGTRPPRPDKATCPHPDVIETTTYSDAARRGICNRCDDFVFEVRDLLGSSWIHDWARIDNRALQSPFSTRI